ncbi:MBOAT family O-acyltransferase [Flavobacterium paronense]|uniref:MBOAT family O-acyltransferase n=1 Tax=Flavobacterium paronense TaxID=1392775 RepID=A0ABV5GB39_9FLAO|nr:MBOAT family O-acyltransferase [Flavobacterium paronense]MDN3675787.1 MBOAT family O-acyltransferase [Flavobacterium paronense]MDN3675797.1 MBOAT family O-acyltransferase [Flavobacterium paronense]MDN3676836.1 MBOAT family O-acyltransferase [Flavobacterium paronense]
MIFNSIPFVLFFSLFFCLYWFVTNKNLKTQNVLILIGSYFFYAWSDWRLLSFLIGVSALNYFLGIKIETTSNPKWRKVFLYIGLLQGIGGLLFFKYYNFFIISFNEALSIGLPTLKILVPLGISFFTFRTISYLLDIDKGKQKATTDWIIFFNYVAFFPSLLSGPIDKANKLIPQLEKSRTFDYNIAVDGLRQILWGLFKKVVIANNCAVITSEVFANYHNLPASSLLIGTFLYTIQIYADFSGYSDMAIGFANLLGIKITKNFDFPFFAQNIADFWRRWHISLTSWLTEYVFTPLCIYFRDYNNLGLILAIVINFTLIGIWHGANWTYILFGFLHGLYYIPLILKDTLNKKKKLGATSFPSFLEVFNMMKTFVLVMFTFVIFKSNSITEAVHFYKSIFSKSLMQLPVFKGVSVIYFVSLLLYILFLFVLEWNARKKEHALENFGIGLLKPIRWTLYSGLVLVIYYFSSIVSNQDFIYFQF